jgi:thioredoxin reductase (NADPH)
LQAAKFGARLVVSADVVDLARRPDRCFAITVRDGRVFTGRSVVVATGARYRRLDVCDLDRFVGAGVYYAATAVEARRCAGGSVVIVGGGNSAGQAALYLAEHAARCRLIIRGPDLSRSMSQYLIDQLADHPEIELITHTRLTELHGGDVLDAVTLHDDHTGRNDQIAVCGLFVFIGAVPCTGWLRDTLATDDKGFVLTGRDLPASALANYHSDLPLVSETSQPGVFAVGDVRAGSVKRAASAVGEGSMAVRMIHQRLAHPATLTAPHPDAPPSTPTRVAVWLPVSG